MANNSFVLDRLRSIIENSMEATETKMADFDSPAWPYLAAYNMGKKSAYESIIKLLTKGKNHADQ